MTVYPGRYLYREVVVQWGEISSQGIQEKDVTGSVYISEETHTRRMQHWRIPYLVQPLE
jgi:hypothetical protein